MVNVLKPPGMTAHDVVGALRRKLGTRQVGHAGTLDPLAVGVLPVAIGFATRLLRYLPGEKTYRAEVCFGRATDTLDAAGPLTAEAPFPLSEDALREVLPRFMGEIDQVPPMASAVHHEGKRLYELHRAGMEVERKSRRVTIHALQLVRFAAGPFPRAVLDMRCSAGTYVRSLAADLGEALGGPAYLSFLLRTAAGPFALERALRLEEVGWEVLVPPEEFLSDLPPVRLDFEGESAVSHGRAVPAPGLAAPHARLYGMSGSLLGVARVEEGTLRPETMRPSACGSCLEASS